MVELTKIIYIIIFLSLINTDTIAQNHFEVFYGMNERAKSDYERADVILNRSPGFIGGFKYSRIYFFKEKPYLGSAGLGFLTHQEFFSDFKYEFGEDRNTFRVKKLSMGFATIKFCKLFNYNKENAKKDFYFGGGFFVLFNVASVSGSVNFIDNNTNTFRKYWSYNVDSNGLELLPGLTALANYKIKVYKKLFLVFGLNYDITPFSAADLDFTIDSKDGVFEGSFYHRIHNINLSVGFGF